MGPELAAGLFALGGVIVGALATTGSQVYLDKQREQRESDRAKRLVAGDLLHAQLILRSMVQMGQWFPIGDPDALLPNSAWKEHRSRLADSVDAELFDELVMAYASLEFDRARMTLAANVAPNPLAPSDSANLRKTGYELGRLRKRLGGVGTGWRDEIVEEVSDSFVKLLDGYKENDLEIDDAVVAKLQQVANEIAALRPDDGEAWLVEINRRLEGR